MKRFLGFAFLIGCFSMAGFAVAAQEVVHALVGTVTSIDSAAKAITVKPYDGSESLFKDRIGSKTRIEFDKNIRADSTSAVEFKKSGTGVMVYYFGVGTARAAVALRNLGSGPFTRSVGTVLKFESKEHSISIKESSGTAETFKITSDTVAETDEGAIEGLKLRPQTGDLVQITATAANGGQTALLINTSYAP